MDYKKEVCPLIPVTVFFIKVASSIFIFNLFWHKLYNTFYGQLTLH